MADLPGSFPLQGHIIRLETNNPRHISGTLAPKAAPPAGESAEGGFGKLLFQALGRVNDAQNHSMEMSQALITDPESVDVHDVTIAVAEASLSLSMTKAILDRAIRAYREIIATR